MLAGNLASIGVGGIVTTVVSLIVSVVPQNPGTSTNSPFVVAGELRLRGNPRNQQTCAQTGTRFARRALGRGFARREEARVDGHIARTHFRGRLPGRRAEAVRPRCAEKRVPHRAGHAGYRLQCSEPLSFLSPLDWVCCPLPRETPLLNTCLDNSWRS